MKKIWKEKSDYFTRIQRYRNKRANKKRELDKKRKKRLNNHPNSSQKTEYVYIRAPKTFSLLDKDSRKDLLKFLKKMRNGILKSTKSISLNFSNTENMVSDATLLFKAELCRTMKLSTSTLNDYGLKVHRLATQD